MKLDRETIAYASALFALVVVQNYALELSGLRMEDVIRLGHLNESIQQIITPEFTAWLLLFPAVFGLLTVFAKIKDRGSARFVVGAAVAGGQALALLLYPNVLSFAWPLIFYVAGAFVYLEMLYWHFAEFKKHILVRAVQASFDYFILLMSLGFALGVGLYVTTQPDFYLQDFEAMVVGAPVTSRIADTYVQRETAQIISHQRSLLESLASSREYAELKAGADPSKTAFIERLEELRNRLSSPAYEQQVMTSVQRGDGGLGVFESLKTRMPLFGVIEQNFWFMLAFVFTAAFYVLAKAVLKPLAVVYAILLERVLGFVYTNLLYGKAAQRLDRFYGRSGRKEF